MGPGWHSPVVVGRDEELDVLRQAVIRARQGAGGMVLVTGEAGIGKSRLLEEASGYARTLGMAVLAGRAVEGGGPYRPVAEAFSARLRDAAVPVPDELRPFRPALARLLPGWLPDEPVTGVDPVVVLGEGVLRLLRIVAGQEGAGWPGTLGKRQSCHGPRITKAPRTRIRTAYGLYRRRSSSPRGRPRPRHRSSRIEAAFQRHRSAWYVITSLQSRPAPSRYRRTERICHEPH
jgi:hypothetical protein